MRAVQRCGRFWVSFGLGTLLHVACSGSPSDPPLHSVVDGRWTTDCVVRQDLFDSYRIQLDLQKAQSVTRTEYYFADRYCGEPVASLQYSGRYELIVTSRDLIYGIDLFYQEQTLEALNATGQERLEQRAFCGRQHWPLAEAQNPLSFDPGNCSAVGPVPLKNLNLVAVNRGHSLDFGSDIANENERPLDVAADPQLLFYSQPFR